MNLGIDVGGTKIELARFRDDFSLVDSTRQPTPVESYHDFLSTILAMVQAADDRKGTASSVGIGLPCTFDSEERAHASGIPCLSGQRVKQDLSDALSRPVAFENDVNSFTLSEANGGAGEGYRNVLGLVLGTGVGGGLCINGELYRSRQGVACEYGHLPIPPKLKAAHGLPDRICGCGLEDCYNIYVSGSGIRWLAEHEGHPEVDPKHLLSEVVSGEQWASKVFDVFVDLCGAFVAQLTLMYDPDVIVLGGGISKSSLIYQRLPDAITPHLLKGVLAPPVVAPKFGDASGVRGVAQLGRQAWQAQFGG